MSAELLRRAAAKIRENAEAARSYFADHHPNAGQEVPWFTEADLYDFDEGDGPHIIGMSPDFAVAVADSLAKAADRMDHFGYQPGDIAAIYERDFAVARAYLGEA